MEFPASLWRSRVTLTVMLAGLVLLVVVIQSRLCVSLFQLWQWCQSIALAYWTERPGIYLLFAISLSFFALGLIRGIVFLGRECRQWRPVRSWIKIHRDRTREAAFALNS